MMSVLNLQYKNENGRKYPVLSVLCEYSALS